MRDVDLQTPLVRHFADAVMKGAGLPDARREDVEAAPSFSAADDEIKCTCGITGSTYAESWDGSTTSAEAFATAVGEATADLVARKPKNHYYAWLTREPDRPLRVYS